MTDTNPFRLKPIPLSTKKVRGLPWDLPRKTTGKHKISMRDRKGKVFN